MFEAAYQEHDLYVSCKLTGPPHLREVLRSLDDLALRCRSEWRGKPVLLDLRDIRPIPEVTVRALVGEHIAVSLRSVSRIASVVLDDAYTGQSEKVAQRLGVELLVFTSLQQALDWLTESE